MASTWTTDQNNQLHVHMSTKMENECVPPHTQF